MGSRDIMTIADVATVCQTRTHSLHSENTSLDSLFGGFSGEHRCSDTLDRRPILPSGGEGRPGVTRLEQWGTEGTPACQPGQPNSPW